MSVSGTVSLPGASGTPDSQVPWDIVLDLPVLHTVLLAYRQEVPVPGLSVSGACPLQRPHQPHGDVAQLPPKPLPARGPHDFSQTPQDSNKEAALLPPGDPGDIRADF